MVSHSGFLRVGVSQRHYANADYRVFDFAKSETDELVEWEATEERGGGMGKSRKGLALIEPRDFRHERQEQSQESVAQAPEEVTREIPGPTESRG